MRGPKEDDPKSSYELLERTTKAREGDKEINNDCEESNKKQEMNTSRTSLKRHMTDDK